MQNSNNAKVRSLEMIENRKATAKAMYDTNQFALNCFQDDKVIATFKATPNHFQ